MIGVISVIGVLFVGAVFAVLFAYACTQFLLNRFDFQRRLLMGEKSLLIIFGSNLASLALLWIAGFFLLTASGRSLYVQAAVIAVAAQAIWLCRHLWIYHRDHLRLHYESYEN